MRFFFFQVSNYLSVRKITNTKQALSITYYYNQMSKLNRLIYGHYLPKDMLFEKASNFLFNRYKKLIKRYAYGHKTFLELHGTKSSSTIDDYIQIVHLHASKHQFRQFAGEMKNEENITLISHLISRESSSIIDF